MIRVLNFFCVALMGLSILALYHVSERTRVTHVQLGRIEHRIADERTEMSVLEMQWEQVARPDRIQQLAETSLGMGDAATIQLSSLELLPHRGDENAPLGGARMREANARMPAPAPVGLVKIAVRNGM